MNTALILHDGDWLGEAAWLALDEFAHACEVEASFVMLLVDEGLLTPPPAAPAGHFGGEELARVRRIRRLQRDFDASLPSVALMLDLLDEIERLRGALLRAGLEP